MVILLAAAVVGGYGPARLDKGGENLDLVDVFEITPEILRSTFMLRDACNQDTLREVPGN